MHDPLPAETEEGLPDRRGGEGALGGVPSEPGALTAGDDERGDLAGAKKLLAGAAGLVVVRRLVGTRFARIVRRWLDVVRQVERRLVLDVRLDQPATSGQSMPSIWSSSF